MAPGSLAPVVETWEWAAAPLVDAVPLRLPMLSRIPMQLCAGIRRQVLTHLQQMPTHSRRGVFGDRFARSLSRELASSSRTTTSGNRRRSPASSSRLPHSTIDRRPSCTGAPMKSCRRWQAMSPHRQERDMPAVQDKRKRTSFEQPRARTSKSWVAVRGARSASATQRLRRAGGEGCARGCIGHTLHAR